LQEVRAHLDDATADLVARGASRSNALEQAIGSFGSAEDLAAQFNAQRATATLRRSVVGVVVLGAVVAAGLVVAVLGAPPPDGQTTAPLPFLVPFHAGLVAFQIAVVSGLITAARMAPRWRASALATDDRETLRGSIDVLLGSLVATAVAWSTALVLRAGVQGHSRPALLAGGIAAMVSSAGVAAAVHRLLKRLPSDNPWTPDSARAGGIAVSGERLLAAICRRPVLSCLGVAAIAGIGAVMRAESTLPVALPWGAGEAFCVIAAFAVLGPTLGIRGDEHIADDVLG
jgi:hypothetical protein